MRFVDLKGRRFGRWRVIQQAENKRGRTAWHCRCDCGTEAVVVSVILGKSSRSCGCLKSELSTTRSTTHGKSRSSEYNSYQSAKNRCRNSSCKQYKDYGGRGIQFLYGSFEQFIADVGRKSSPLHSLDRIDVNGNYEPGNCRWATAKQQMVNRRCISVYEQDIVKWFGDTEGKIIWETIKQNYQLSTPFIGI